MDKLWEGRGKRKMSPKSCFHVWQISPELEAQVGSVEIFGSKFNKLLDKRNLWTRLLVPHVPDDLVAMNANVCLSRPINLSKAKPITPLWETNQQALLGKKQPRLLGFSHCISFSLQDLGASRLGWLGSSPIPSNSCCCGGYCRCCWFSFYSCSWQESWSDASYSNLDEIGSSNLNRI